MRFTTPERVQFEAPITVTPADFRLIVTEQLQRVGIDLGAISIDPEEKNMAPAVAIA